MIAHQKEERSVLRGFVLPAIVCKFGQGEVVGPVGLLMVGEEPEIRFYPLIVPLRLSIGPWVIHRRDVLLNPQCAAQFLDEPGGESWISVAYDFAREPIASNYDFEEHLRSSFRRNGLIAWHKMCHFCTPLVCDREYGVVSVERG